MSKAKKTGKPKGVSSTVGNAKVTVYPAARPPAARPRPVGFRVQNGETTPILAGGAAASAKAPPAKPATPKQAAANMRKLVDGMNAEWKPKRK